MSSVSNYDDVRHALVDELAQVLGDPEIAQLCALRAGYPRERFPPFGTPLQFWSRVVQEVENGVIPLRDLLDE